jgi:hypothetical protein
LLAAGGIGATGAAADTFTYTAAEQTYQVPAGVTRLHVVLVGAPGGTPANGFGTPGTGAQLVGDLPVPPGVSTLYVEVGGGGAQAEPPKIPYAATGGWNGGGSGAAGGGGASDIRSVSCGAALACVTGGSSASLNSRLAVAGGGGGGGAGANGGSAGNADGSGSSGDSTISGTGATPAAPGQAADSNTVKSYCITAGAQNGDAGSPGDLGVGGGGAYASIAGTPLSGGGGAGLYGGGGGAQCWTSGTTATTTAGAGGAGSSGAPSAQNVSITIDQTGMAEVIITAPVPTTSGQPALSGGLAVGDVVTASHAAWESTLPLSGYAYVWERCDAGGASCSPIAGATGQAYTLQAADLGHTVRVQESALNFYGSSAPATSAASGVIGQVPQETGAPTIAGTARQGQVLVESHALWSAGPISSFAYQWERCNASGGACAAIAGATNQAYTPAASDVGSTIRVQETATNGYGASAPAVSAPTGRVEASILGRINAALTWAIASRPRIRILTLSVERAVRGMTVVVLCRGGGCSHSATFHVRTRGLALARHLRHWHLSSSTKLTVRFERPRYVGKVYVFSMRHPGSPLIACLAPGSVKPGAGC